MPCFCACACWGTAALAEDAAAATDTATTAVTELNDTDVLATVNGEEVSWDEVKSLYSSLVSPVWQRLRPDPAGQCGPVPRRGAGKPAYRGADGAEGRANLASIS